MFLRQRSHPTGPVHQLTPAAPERPSVRRRARRPLNNYTTSRARHPRGTETRLITARIGKLYLSPPPIIKTALPPLTIISIRLILRPNWNITASLYSAEAQTQSNACHISINKLIRGVIGGRDGDRRSLRTSRIRGSGGGLYIKIMHRITHMHRIQTSQTKKKSTF